MHCPYALAAPEHVMVAAVANLFSGVDAGLAGFILPFNLSTCLFGLHLSIIAEKGKKHRSFLILQY